MLNGWILAQWLVDADQYDFCAKSAYFPCIESMNFVNFVHIKNNVPENTIMPRLAQSLTRRILAVSIFMTLPVSFAWSHYPWINIDAQPATSGTLQAQLGWGHSFPNDGILASNRVYDLRLFNADGSFVHFSEFPESVFTAPASEGAQLISFQQVRSFYSQTRQGGRGGNKATLDGVLSCNFSNNSGKALVGGGSVMNQPVHHALEIIPLADLKSLQVGHTFPIQVLWHDQPFVGTVQATSSSHPNDVEGQYPVQVETNAQGLAELPITQAGFWMFKATAQSSFHDETLCDTNGYLATLTFWMP